MAKTIMVVDDSASFRSVVGIALKGAGYDVIEACDGRDALAKLDGKKIHLIVSDVNMPNMDGIAFVREVKKNPSYKFTPVIMLTTEAAEEKKQAEERSITKAVRTLYMDLVKHLHPDREPDEAEKNRKTELLKQVTTAYEANELLTLLRLQLELNRIDQEHLETLADDQLRYYNTLLKDQVRELDQALLQEQVELQRFTGKPYYYTTTPAAMTYDYERQKQQLEAKIKELANDLQTYAQDLAALKAFLKSYKIPKAGSGPLPVRV